MGRWEDLTDPGLAIGRILCALILFLVYVPPWVWLALSFVDQSMIQYSIQDFYIAGADSTSSSNFNQSIIYFKLDIVNPGKSMGVYYDNINLTFSYYATEDDLVPLVNYTIQGFRQGVDKKTDRKDFVVTTRGMAWQEISNNVPVLSLLPSVSSDVVFRVDLATAVRFREFMTGTKSKRLQTMAWCEVEVDQMTGKKSSDKAIKLNHMIKHHLSGWLVFGLIILLLATFLSLCLCILCLGGVATLLGGQ